jgi:phage FluMu protein Com
MNFVNCPNCGRKLLEGKEGSFVQVKCTKCNRIFAVEITSQGVSVILQKQKEDIVGAL